MQKNYPAEEKRWRNVSAVRLFSTKPRDYLNVFTQLIFRFFIFLWGWHFVCVGGRVGGAYPVVLVIKSSQHTCSTHPSRDSSSTVPVPNRDTFNIRAFTTFSPTQYLVYVSYLLDVSSWSTVCRPFVTRG